MKAKYVCFYITISQAYHLPQYLIHSECLINICRVELMKKILMQKTGLLEEHFQWLKGVDQSIQIRLFEVWH